MNYVYLIILHVLYLYQVFYMKYLIYFSHSGGCYYDAKNSVLYSYVFGLSRHFLRRKQRKRGKHGTASCGKRTAGQRA